MIEKKLVRRGPREAAQAAKPMATKEGKEIRGIVRLAGKDLRGDMPLGRALSMIKGIGQRMASVLRGIASAELKLPDNAVIGELSESQIAALEELMENPTKHGVPSWMLNRQKDIETGTDRHLIGTDLAFVIKQDIEREKESGTWIGYRHNYGQKVRGQRTRTTGRKGMTVGVMRKAMLAKAAGAGAASGAASKAETKKSASSSAEKK